MNVRSSTLTSSDLRKRACGGEGLWAARDTRTHAGLRDRCARTALCLPLLYVLVSTSIPANSCHAARLSGASFGGVR